jgi:hypothetical protein
VIILACDRCGLQSPQEAVLDNMVRALPRGWLNLVAPNFMDKAEFLPPLLLCGDCVGALQKWLKGAARG